MISFCKTSQFGLYIYMMERLSLTLNAMHIAVRRVKCLTGVDLHCLIIFRGGLTEASEIYD